MKMTVEEFYLAIRLNQDPVDFKDVENQLDNKTYALSVNKIDPFTRFYLKQFINYKEKGKIISRNIPFIFFGGIWLAYRRIYWLIPMLFVIDLLTYFFLSIFNLEDNPFIVLSIFIPDIIGSFFVNYIYFWNTECRINKGKDSQADRLFLSILKSLGLQLLTIIVLIIILSLLEYLFKVSELFNK